MQLLKINILGLIESNWLNSGEIFMCYTKLYCSGNNKTEHHWEVVAILIDLNHPKVPNASHSKPMLSQLTRMLDVLEQYNGE